jgi:hypothetical protein
MSLSKVDLGSHSASVVRPAGQLGPLGLAGSQLKQTAYADA